MNKKDFYKIVDRHTALKRQLILEWNENLDDVYDRHTHRELRLTVIELTKTEGYAHRHRLASRFTLLLKREIKLFETALWLAKIKC